ncbi:MAG TPA: calcium-binding protein [Ktedonobacteraceae bacterium]|jgi:hypothetical protein|nr:calcium-binding protein [Ktedonobacteraceae bacterium]
MSPQAKDEEREERIANEIIVDAYGSEERMTGWYTYLSDTLSFPFTARCVRLRPTSPLEQGASVRVLGMASIDLCEQEILVLILWKRRQLAVPLFQLEGVKGDEETEQAIEDWHYWVNCGYTF